MKNDIEALRGFSNLLVDKYKIVKDNGCDKVLTVLFEAENFGLIDKDGNKTELLTGSKDSITTKQERLYFMWIDDIRKSGLEQFKGQTKEDLHWMLKEEYLIPIFRKDDSGFAEMYMLYESLMNEQESIRSKLIIKNKFLGGLSITDCDKEQGVRYLTMVESFCWDNGVKLRTNDYLYKAAGMK